MQLDIDNTVVEGYTVVIPRGELDLVTQTKLKNYVHDLVVGGAIHLVIDLDETTFLDSTGLGALIGARRLTHTFQGSFALVCSQPRLLRLLKIVSLDKVFTIHASRDELVKPQVS